MSDDSLPQPMTAWREGPRLEPLLRRLAETPEDFLAEPRIQDSGTLEVRAIVADLLRLLGFRVDPAALAPFAGGSEEGERNRLTLVALMCWLLADESIRGSYFSAAAMLRLLREDAAELARLGPAKRFVTDAERREELARLVLARLGFHPAGESQTQAQDRLVALSSTERARVLRASQAAMRRAREIREALARQAAAEAADKYTRE